MGKGRRGGKSAKSATPPNKRRRGRKKDGVDEHGQPNLEARGEVLEAARDEDHKQPKEVRDKMSWSLGLYRTFAES